MLHDDNVLIKVRYELGKGDTYKLWQLRPAQNKGDDHTALPRSERREQRLGFFGGGHQTMFKF